MATNQLVHDASAFPWNAVVLIRVTFPDGSLISGSGAIVGENDILTASHVVYSAEHGGAATEIKLYPGFDDASGLDEYLTGRYVFDYFELPEQCTTATRVNDYALIGVETRFHSWFGLSSGYYAHYDRLYSVQQSGYDGLIADWYGRPVQAYSTGSVY